MIEPFFKSMSGVKETYIKKNIQIFIINYITCIFLFLLMKGCGYIKKN